MERSDPPYKWLYERLNSLVGGFSWGTATFSLAILGMGLSGILTQPLVISALVLFVLTAKHKLNWGIVAIGPLLPLCFGPCVEGDSICYDLPIAMSTLYHHSLLLLQDNTVSTWMHQSDLFLTLAPHHGKEISVICFTLCSVILYDILPAYKWMAPVIILSSAGVMRLAGSAKYDSPMILFCFIGASNYVKGRIFNAGLAMGCACACKIQAVPLMVAMGLFCGQSVKFYAGTAVLLAPWMIRQYIVMGNPLFPVFGSEFSETYYPALRRMQTMSISGFSLGWDTFVPMVLMLSPFILWMLPLASGEYAIIGLLGALGIWFGLTPQPRYLLACLPFFAVPLMGLCGKMFPRRTMILLAVAMCLSVIPDYMVSLNQPPMPYSYTQAMRACRGKNVLSYGEERRYPNWEHGDVFWSYMSQPLFWKLAKEAPTKERILVRIRQLGCDYLLINPYSLKAQEKFIIGFNLNPRGAKLVKDFFDNNLVPAWRGDVLDGAGGYFLYKII